MADNSRIEWTDATYNPIVGCSKASEGCQHCYAERMAHRLNSNPKTPQYWDLVVPAATNSKPWLEGTRWAGITRLVEDALDQPLRWKRPRRIFVCSMGDLFHETVQEEWLDRVFAVMDRARRHTFLVLTKRPARMLEYITSRRQTPAFTGRNFAFLMGARSPASGAPAHVPWPLPNVWLGVTAENQKRADERVPLLLNTPAAVRFVSVEPMLEDVDLTRIRLGDAVSYDALRGIKLAPGAEMHQQAKLDWVICGGETGPGARPMHPDWARSLRDQCVAAEVPFFFKQWGEWCPAESLWEASTLQNGVFASSQVACDSEGRHYLTDNPKGHWFEDSYYSERVGTKAAGNALDGEIIEQLPEVGNG
ncbi:phage Gp37/Gp68 family protein [Desulfocurvibacter africanus]|uniref:Gp37Gp68 family protein n=1 Tax=Desulfocurvibacter africanus subsp. africanus str. Walvis Bay TaxID=690850 RepID=F3Z332_DESAF|nr:phage Gp37/Gp68 family protein [Desulfocurvibacter africanus]EGJ50276.1 Gp37Gp68 family protein [Desulfocurvibacter africanus subsp. africanus str. Walvis Bay]